MAQMLDSVGTTDQFLAGLQARIAQLQAMPQTADVVAAIARLRALAVGLA